MTVVIASHLPGEGHFRSDKYTVLPLLCVDDFDYWAGLARQWTIVRTIVNIEHDIEATDDHIAELLDCPHDPCSYVYACHWQTTHTPHDVNAAGNGNSETQRTYCQGGEEWAEWSAIGAVKITPAARIGPLAKAHWSRVELSIENAVSRPWHLHWGTLNHHHW